MQGWRRFALVNLILEQLRRYAAAYGREDALDVALHETMQAFFRQNGSLEDFLAARRNALQTKRQFRLESADSLTAAEGILRKIEQWGLEAKQARCGDGAVRGCGRRADAPVGHVARGLGIRDG